MNRLKVQLAGTRLGTAAEQARWLLGTPRRRRHPELWDLYLESSRIDHICDAIVRPDWCCLDGGSHVGSFLARVIGRAPRGRHIAVEPSVAKARLLRRRFPDVAIVEAALGSQPGSLPFFDDPSGYASLGAAARDAGRGRARDVEVVTIDQCVDGGRLDLLKLDIEGAELWAMRGGRATIERESPTIIFECGPESTLTAFGHGRDDVYTFVTDELNYSIFALVDFLYARAPLNRAEFARAAVYPYRGFNYVAIPAGASPARIAPDLGGW